MPAPTITALPTPPSRNEPSTFSARANAFLGALPTFRAEVNAVGSYIDDTASNIDAAVLTVEAARDAAITAVNAQVWRPNTSYLSGAVTYSPITFQTFRAKTSHSGVATDPSADPTNWVQLSVNGEFLQRSGGTLLGTVFGHGNAASPLIAAIDNVDTGFYFGVSGGVRVPAVSVEGAVAAIFHEAGNALVSTSSVVTREKGDARDQQVSSTLRFKDGARELTEAEAGVLLTALQPLLIYVWTWGGELPSDDPRRGKIGIGAVAEEVHNLLPPEWRDAFVFYDEQGRPSGLNAHSAVGVLILINRMQNAKLVDLTARVEALETAP